MRKAVRNVQAAGVEDQFTAALTELVEQVKRDRTILAAMLCGSLSHDAVWAKSDIDLVLVTTDEKNPLHESLCLYADGINVHAVLMPRAEFRKLAEGAVRNSFVHSFLAKGRLLYTHDETIDGLCKDLAKRGDRDARLQMFAAASRALPAFYKAQKWLLTREDLDYAALWILYCAEALAKVEVLEAGMLVDRESLPQAFKLNPSVFKVVYSDLLNSIKTRKSVDRALSAVQEYLRKRALRIFDPILEHLKEAGEARSATEIEDHFRRNYGVEGVTIACEYLSDEGLIGKAPVAVRLTKRSNVDVNEMAFFCGIEEKDAF